MKLKRFSFISILTIVSSVSYSQDEIVKKDGSIILSKILEVSSSQVKYHKYSNPDGPIYTINTSKIQVINFDNGFSLKSDSKSKSLSDKSILLV